MAITQKDIINVDINLLDDREKQKCVEAFKAFDKNGSKRLEKEELRIVLEEMGQNPTDQELIKMIAEVDITGEGAIGLEDFMKAIALQKKILANNDDEDIYLAFLAMGGDEARNGHIDSQKLIQVIRDEFEMTIDIQRLIREMDLNGSDKIEYQEFKNLLNN